MQKIITWVWFHCMKKTKTRPTEGKRKDKVQRAHTCQYPKRHIPLVSLILWHKNGDHVLLCLASNLANVVRLAGDENLSFWDTVLECFLVFLVVLDVIYSIKVIFIA